MKKIDISITKAQIKSFTVDLSGKKPEVNVSIVLINDYGKEITDYSISTSHWEDENKFDIPVSIIKPIIKIARSLEVVAVKHCNKDQQQLTSGEIE